ncbi:PucR family transcriptional regulator [Rhodococcus qingshengii]|uniref:PucR family transcriptional regulator n=1 Tax=Rhodococcus qingshengii TaxID=334542 RepID=UPI00237D0D43|nr:helix-turn-helix domain-containing protein [Rhodococcus qingshengii]WCT05858.1 helix-turn-helix domain-containing protein [Rhodococcus qingshengii]
MAHSREPGPAHDEQWQHVIARAHARAAGLATTLKTDDLLPHSMLDADFVPSVQLNIALFFRSLVMEHELTREDTRPIVERALRLVRDGMSLEEILTNYRVGTAFLWSESILALEPEEYPLLPKLGLCLTNYLNLVVTHIATTLIEDSRQPRWDLLERQGEIAADLLAGRGVSGWTGAPDIPIAESFLVAAVRLGQPAPGTLTTLRHRLGRLPGTFLYRDNGGWIALVPLRPGDERDPAAALEDRIMLSNSCIETEFWIGAAPALTRADIPGAYIEARTVAETARALARPETICTRNRMIFEYSVAAGGPTLTALAALLDPLAAHPALLETLDTFIDSQFNHNACAQALFIHRNTVTYRLSRIAELTGYDPLLASGVSTLMAARVAQRIVTYPAHTTNPHRHRSDSDPVP